MLLLLLQVYLRVSVVREVLRAQEVMIRASGAHMPGTVTRNAATVTS
jgi:hypothetical protein